MKENKKARKTPVGAIRNGTLFKDISKEKGITLIALIIMIVVLVILSAVVIRGIAGGGIIGTSEVAAEEYNVTSYKEQIEQKVRGTVQSYTGQGEEIDISKIAEELNNETLWVKNAVANTNKDLGNEDIIIRTTDGYIFQIYYDGTYGVVFTEYIGKDDGGEIPTLKARFEKRIAAILAEAKGAGRLELIYRGEVAGGVIENPNGEQRMAVDEIGTGWYKVRAVAENGHLRYAWVRATTISEKLTPPNVTVTPVDPNKGEGNDGWYLGAVKVKAETDNENAKEIHYTIIENGITIKEDQKYEGEIEIGTTGVTRVIMWTVDEEGYTSEEVIKDIKIDGEAPKVTYEEKSAKEKVGDWYKGDVEIIVKGEDRGSGIDGYYYKIVGENVSFSEKKNVGEEGDKIIITKEGITEIKVKVVDKAGNESGEETITIKKDTVAPEFQGNVEINNEKIDGFTIKALARDEVSGNPANGGNITYKFYITKDGKEELLGENNTGIMEVAGLKMGTTYDVRVEAIDPAGNKAERLGRGTTSSNRNPQFIDGPKEKSKTNTTIKLTMTAKDDDGDNVTYVVKYGAYDANGNKGAYIGTKEVPNVTQGVAKDVDISNLSNYTNYYFEVTAEDTKGGKTEVKEFDVKTYCKATYCAGRTRDRCDECYGSGIWTWQFGGHNFQTSPGSARWTCSQCGETCDAHTSSHNHGSCIVSRRCDQCKGEGYVTTNCSHSKSSSHYVCESHKYDGSSEYHS